MSSDIASLTDEDLDALRIEVIAEQERRQLLRDAPAQAATLATAKDQPADDRVSPGQRVVLDDIEYRNKSGAWLPISVGPACRICDRNVPHRPTSYP